MSSAFTGCQLSIPQAFGTDCSVGNKNGDGLSKMFMRNSQGMGLNGRQKAEGWKEGNRQIQMTSAGANDTDPKANGSLFNFSQAQGCQSKNA